MLFFDGNLTIQRLKNKHIIEKEDPISHPSTENRILISLTLPSLDFILPGHIVETDWVVCMKAGVLAGFLAFFLWGLFPIYWKAVQQFTALEIVGHRIVWSFLFLAILLLLFNREKSWPGRHWNRKILFTYLTTAALLAVNWFTFIWAVTHNYLVDASLGYFINPLVNVLFGVLFLKERMRGWQWVAITLAAFGVLNITVNYGQFPWIAMILATTFGFYGLLRKIGALASLQGLFLEMSILFIPALIFLFLLERQGIAHFGHLPFNQNVLLSFAGIVTALPLLLFAYAAKRINLSTIGFLQYIAPTGQFLLGVWLYQEALSHARLIGFIFIWIALAIYSAESLLVFGTRSSRIDKARVKSNI
jgi:chloramphenicol-sensitive protein RarD